MRSALAVIGVLAALALPALAHADGDPASDYLLAQSTFVPPDAGVPPAYANQLAATVREAKARGYPIRVAVIGSRYDMGSVTSLYEKPQLYARFLGTELGFVYKGRLLVVMPNGLAVSRNGKSLPAEQRVVDRIAAPGKRGAALASAATTGVVRLAASSGVVMPPAPLAASGRSGSNTTRDRLTIVAAVAVLLLLVGVVFLYRRQRRP